jgi:peptidoglycan/xylan/chitin deacetylase (PgdA/CDA1 family)
MDENVDMLKRLTRRGLDAADSFFATVGPRSHAQSGTLVAVLFHSLCREASQTAGSAVARDQKVTVDDFRRFVDALLEEGYRVVSPEQVDDGLAPGGKYAMITFDDGYFNNTLALDVLETFQVPATFFISTDHVLQNKAFWWDALSRELAQIGTREADRRAEFKRLKGMTSDRIESHITSRFGESALRPRSDRDRPFAPNELRDFARNEWVHLGNHTCNHAILTHCSRSDMVTQVQGCQQALEQIAGRAPIAIAYPNGNHSQAAVEVCLEAGLRIGLTVLPRGNPLPLNGEATRMTLGRFEFRPGQDARTQCRKFSAGFVPSIILKTLINSANRSTYLQR